MCRRLEEAQIFKFHSADATASLTPIPPGLAT
jgi:hypothetical protein